jgi:hypothetical protein
VLKTNQQHSSNRNSVGVVLRFAASALRLFWVGLVCVAERTRFALAGRFSASLHCE